MPRLIFRKTYQVTHDDFDKVFTTIDIDSPIIDDQLENGWCLIGVEKRPLDTKEGEQLRTTGTTKNLQS